MFNTLHDLRSRKPNRRRASCPATVTPMFPGSDPTSDFADALTQLGWFTPAQLTTLGAIDPEFAPVARMAAARSRMIDAGTAATRQASAP